MASKKKENSYKRVPLVALLTFISVFASIGITTGILASYSNNVTMGGVIAIMLFLPAFLLILFLLLFGMKFALKNPLKGIVVYLGILIISGGLFLHALMLNGTLFKLPFLSTGQIAATKQEMQEFSRAIGTTVYYPEYIPPKTEPSYSFVSSGICPQLALGYNYVFNVYEMQDGCDLNRERAEEFIDKEEIVVPGITLPVQYTHYYFGSTRGFTYTFVKDTTKIIIEFDLSSQHILPRDEVIKMIQSFKPAN